MGSKVDNSDEESFIILGTSPGTSLDVKMNEDLSFDKMNLEDALKDLSCEANMAFKAHFKLGECPSPASLMVASTMVTDEASTEELQKRFGELLDENVILKETLKQNNDSMKEQFLLIASCQEDMLNTQKLHKEKFDETKELVEKLRQENKRLKQELQSKEESLSKSGPSSGLEFVTSPEDDVINKLTAQLELVERQRRQVLVDNDKLTWQKDSLEHIVDAITKERDELKEKLDRMVTETSQKECESSLQINSLKASVQELEKKLLSASTTSMTSDDLMKREKAIKLLNDKVSALQAELKKALLKISEMETLKLELTKDKSSANEMIKMYKDQLLELHNQLKETRTTLFQPVRLSVSAESAPQSSETPTLAHNVRVYDTTLKHLADLLNRLSNEQIDNLKDALELCSRLTELKLDRATVDQAKTCSLNLRQRLEEQHRRSLSHTVEVKSFLSIFEGIFKDYSELLKKPATKVEVIPPSPNIETLTAALVARNQDIERMKEELSIVETLRAQALSYKADFEAERQSRQEMACRLENVKVDLRAAQRKVNELTAHLEEVRKANSGVYWAAAQAASVAASASEQPATSTVNGASNGARKKRTTQDNVDMNVVGTPPPQRFICPVCDAIFKSIILLQQHVDSCLL